MPISFATLLGLRTAFICTTTLAAISTSFTAQASPTGITTRHLRKVYLVENAELRLTHNNEYESTLGERGEATGTFDAPVTAALKLSPEHVTATFTIYPHAGSISGTAQANYIVKGSTGYFGGTLTIKHGTGKYRHAYGKNLGISGAINRQHFNMSIKAHGWAFL